MSLSAVELKAISLAAQWYARLHSGVATDADHAAWNAWLVADPAHRHAWQRMTAVGEQMASVPGALASPALRGVQRSRRQVLRSVVVLASAGSLGGLGGAARRGKTCLPMSVRRSGSAVRCVLRMAVRCC